MCWLVPFEMQLEKNMSQYSAVTSTFYRIYLWYLWGTELWHWSWFLNGFTFFVYSVLHVSREGSGRYLNAGTNTGHSAISINRFSRSKTKTVFSQTKKMELLKSSLPPLKDVTERDSVKIFFYPGFWPKTSADPNRRDRKQIRFSFYIEYPWSYFIERATTLL